MTSRSTVAAADAAKQDRWIPLVVTAAWLAGAALSRRAGMWAGVGGVAVALAALLLAARRDRWGELYAVARAPILLGVLVGAFMTLATYPLYALMTELAPVLVNDVGALYFRLGASGRAWRALALVPIVLAEELVWRGAVQSALQRRYGPPAAVLLTAVLYALAQLPVGSPFLVVVALTFGLVWSSLRAATHSVVAPTLAHLLWDEVVLFLIPLIPLG